MGCWLPRGLQIDCSGQLAKVSRVSLLTHTNGKGIHENADTQNYSNDSAMEPLDLLRRFVTCTEVHLSSWHGIRK